MTQRNVGERPTFFDDPAVDQLMAIIMAMSGELSVLYDRVDSLERLLDEKEVVGRDEVDAYRPDEGGEAERRARRTEYIQRLFRIIREDGANLVPHDHMEHYRALQNELAND
jgi:hypothetical protein